MISNGQVTRLGQECTDVTPRVGPLECMRRTWVTPVTFSCGLAPSIVFPYNRPMLKKVIIGCALVAAFTHCVQPVKTAKIHPNCPEIPATTFEKVGLDAKAGALEFGKLVTVGELTIKSDPQIISGISQSVRDDQITDALICAAKERGELKTDEQIAHAWKVARFFARTNPIPAEAMEFYKQNPFPVPLGRQLSEASPSDLQKWMLRQSHLAQLQPLLRRESDKFIVIADRASAEGRISSFNRGTEADAPELEQLLSPEVLSPDLVNHFSEYYQKKQQLLIDIFRQDDEFGDFVARVSRPVHLPSHAENQRVTVGRAFVANCLGKGPGIAVEKYKNGGYSYRILQGEGSNGAGDVPEGLTAVFEAFRSISPTTESRKSCESLMKGAASISVKAMELSVMARRLAEQTVLRGDCEYTKLD